jgi:hypothetical protein
MVGTFRKNEKFLRPMNVETKEEGYAWIWWREHFVHFCFKYFRTESYGLYWESEL